MACELLEGNCGVLTSELIKLGCVREVWEKGGRDDSACEGGRREGASTIRRIKWQNLVVISMAMEPAVSEDMNQLPILPSLKSPYSLTYSSQLPGPLLGSGTVATIIEVWSYHAYGQMHHISIYWGGVVYNISVHDSDTGFDCVLFMDWQRVVPPEKLKLWLAKSITSFQECMLTMAAWLYGLYMFRAGYWE